MVVRTSQQLEILGSNLSYSLFDLIEELTEFPFLMTLTDKEVRRIICNVTRLGNLLDFGQLFKAFGSN